MQTSEILQLNNEFNDQLDSLTRRYAFDHAIGDLHLTPDEAWEYAENAVNTIANTGD